MSDSQTRKIEANYYSGFKRDGRLHLVEMYESFAEATNTIIDLQKSFVEELSIFLIEEIDDYETITEIG